MTNTTRPPIESFQELLQEFQEMNYEIGYKDGKTRNPAIQHVAVQKREALFWKLLAMGDESIRKDEAQVKSDALADGLSPSPANPSDGRRKATPMTYSKLIEAVEALKYDHDEGFNYNHGYQAAKREAIALIRQHESAGVERGAEIICQMVYGQPLGDCKESGDTCRAAYRALQSTPKGGKGELDDEELLHIANVEFDRLQPKEMDYSMDAVEAACKAYHRAALRGKGE